MHLYLEYQKDNLRPERPERKSREDHERERNHGIVGGCAGTRYGCCYDGTTAKADDRGSNCPHRPRPDPRPKPKPEPKPHPEPKPPHKKVVPKNNMDAAKTVQQQGLVLKEWFQYLTKKKTARNQLLRHHNLVCMVRVPVANSVAVQMEKRMPLQNHAKAKLVR